MKFPAHNFNDDAVCVDCGFDGAEHWWLYYHVARAELGDDEWKYRKIAGEYDEPPCKPLPCVISGEEQT